MGEVINIKTREKINTREESQETKAAYQRVAGDYMAVFDMGKITTEMAPVRPLHEEDIWAIVGMANKTAEEKEKMLAGELSGEQASSDEDIIERGLKAKTISMDTAIAVKGQKELINKLREEVLNGLTRKKSEIFIAEGKDASFILNLKQADTKGQQTDATIDSTDITNRGAQWVLVMTPEIGEGIKEIFERNNHRTAEFSIGGGFSAEIGEVRIAFVYPDKVVNKKGELEDAEEEENKKVVQV